MNYHLTNPRQILSRQAFSGYLLSDIGLAGLASLLHAAYVITLWAIGALLVAVLFPLPQVVSLPPMEAPLSKSTRNFRLDAPQHDPQGGADDLRLLESGEIAQPLQDFPVGFSQPDRSFVSQPQIIEMNQEAEGCIPNESCGEGMADSKKPLGETAEAPYSPVPPGVADADRLALDWLLAPKVSASSQLERLLAALVRCEAHANKEGDVWFAEDCRLAWIALYKAFVTKEFKSYRDAEVATYYAMFGKHPAKLHEAILARREALLGPAQLEAAGIPQTGADAIPEATVAPVRVRESGRARRESVGTGVGPAPFSDERKRA